MKTPPQPPDEKRRLQVLEELGILDSEADDWLDRITAYCCSRFRVPISLVSLVDEDRQWFMSCRGLPVKQTPRSVSFCGHAVADDSMLVVADASADSRFSDNPLVSNDPRIRFYAGSPIRIKGQPIGTLCIIDQGVRGLTTEDAAELSELADAVSWYLSHRDSAAGREGAPEDDRAPGPADVPGAPSTRDGDSDPWREAVAYISARRNTVEARMLAHVAFGNRGSDRERGVRPWEEEVLDPLAVRIARGIMAMRSNAIGRGTVLDTGSRDVDHRGSAVIGNARGAEDG